MATIETLNTGPGVALRLQGVPPSLVETSAAPIPVPPVVIGPVPISNIGSVLVTVQITMAN